MGGPKFDPWQQRESCAQEQCPVRFPPREPSTDRTGSEAALKDLIAVLRSPPADDVDEGISEKWRSLDLSGSKTRLELRFARVLGVHGSSFGEVDEKLKAALQRPFTKASSVVQRATRQWQVNTLDSQNLFLRLAVAKYVVRAIDSQDIPRLCCALQLARRFQISRETLQKQLQNAVQAMFDGTYQKQWTHDRRGRQADRQSKEQVPASYTVLTVTPIDSSSSPSRHAGRRGDSQLSEEPLTAPWCRSLAEDGGSCNTWLLLHGTGPSNASQIAQSGFSIQKASAASLCGRALYFAESVTKADEYAACSQDGSCTLLICQVFGGNAFNNFTGKKEHTPRQIDEYDSIVMDRRQCSGTYREFAVLSPEQVVPLCQVTYMRDWRESKAVLGSVNPALRRSARSHQVIKAAPAFRPPRPRRSLDLRIDEDHRVSSVCWFSDD